MQCICLSVILIDSTYRKDKEYYPQAFLEECKHVARGKRMSKLITDDKWISSNHSDGENSDEDNFNKEI